MNELTITDATACIGGDTINFAFYFGHVHSIEINKENFEVLENKKFQAIISSIYDAEASQSSSSSSEEIPISFSTVSW
jgi:hypothetical protein